MSDAVNNNNGETEVTTEQAAAVEAAPEATDRA